MTLFESSLPIGWAWEKISDRYRITKKPKGFDLSTSDKVSFVPMEGVPLGGREPIRYELRHTDEITSGTYFEKGDVLLSKITPSFENGKQGLAHNIPDAFAFGSTEIIPLQPTTSDADRRFLFFYLLHPEVRASLTGKMEGSTGRQRVPEGAVREFPIPMPPKREQEKIAAMLWKVQCAIEVEEKVAATARELKQAVMRKLFTEGMRGEPQKETEIGMIPESWNAIPLGSLGRIGNGSTPLKSNSAYWTNGEIPWLTSAKVYEVTITEADQFVTHLAVSECHLPRVKPGSVLIAITGQGKTLGHAAVTAIETCVSQHLAFISFTDESANPHFVRLFIETRYAELRGAGSAGGSTKGALTCGFLKTFQVPLASRPEQDEITRVLMAIETKVSIHERKSAALSDLFQTLLHQLMSAQIRVDKLDIDTSQTAALNSEPS